MCDPSEPTAIILSGADRYDGKWHDHAATSQRIAEILGEIGIDARLRGTHPRNLGDLSSADLLVVNAANGAPCPDDADDEAWAEAFNDPARLPAIRASRSSRSISRPPPSRNGPGWRPWLGGEWVVGTSMHPPIAQSAVAVNTGTHPIVSDLTTIDVFDEMYSYLETEPGNTILATHTYEGIVHPVAWARETGTGPGGIQRPRPRHPLLRLTNPHHLHSARRPMAA